MKKVFAFVAATVLFAGMASAQLGINVGYAPQTYSSTTYTTLPVLGTTSTNDVQSMNGFFAGVNYNINLTGDLGVSVGADFRYNTASEDIAAGGKQTMTQSLVDVPILFNYGLKLSDALKISVFLGPTVNFALNGMTKVEGTPAGILDGEYDWYSGNGAFKKFDLSGTAGVSLQYNGIRLFGGYNMGLLNTGWGTKDDVTYCTRKGSNWFIGLGYSL